MEAVVYSHAHRLFGTATLTHDGSNPGFRAFGGISLAQKSGFIVMTNGDNGGVLMERLLFGTLMRPTGVALPGPGANR